METGMIKTPVGLIQIRASHDALIALDFLQNRVTCSVPTESSSVIEKTLDELERYFLGKLSVFTIPFVLDVTPFQKKVLERMRKIPFGKTMTYGEFAKEVGGCAQAVGQVCRRNPLPIIIPCHRVVGAKDIGGFCGSLDKEYLSIKQWLLRHETNQEIMSNECVVSQQF